MAALISAEWFKVRTVRSPWWLLVAAMAIVVAGVSGVATGGANLAQPSTVATAASHVGLVALLALMLGITVSAGEYRHRTITDAYLSAPRRRDVVVAKVVVSSAIGLAYGVACAAIAVASIAIWWKAKGVPVAFANAEVLRTLLGGVGWNLAFAGIGAGIGMLVRNLTAAIAISLAWIALAEGVVGQLVGSLARWLPFASGSALGKGPTLGSYTPLTQWQGALALLGYLVAFAGLGAATSARRDVA